MTNAALKKDTLDLLSNNQVRKELVTDLEDLRKSGKDMSRDQVSVILGQWFHPLHYFPTFLARLIAVTPTIEMQSSISRILWQELGQGVPQNAHESIYIETVESAGFSGHAVSNAPPLDGTKKLLEQYSESSNSYLPGLGFLYGTEVADLSMVSTIGDVMRQCAGQQDLPWVDIHVKEEPDHVESSSHTLKFTFAEEDQQVILDSAELMWTHWIKFFRNIKTEIS
jgi:pyrroloquinoline quinone (PQQ) biosynthesis protein C